MNTLIFGANGQDGFYLSQLLQGQGVQVIGISRHGDFLRTDITRYQEVQDLIGQSKPDFIFHLAANSTTRHDALFENHATISTGVLNILESVKKVSPHSKVFISGSGLQFKNEGLPIKETDPFEARDAYSVCRIQSVYAARYYRSLGVRAYIGYFFNHDSPRRTERHVSKMIANAVMDIAVGKESVIEIGDISVKKEWAFANDIVKAMWLLVRQDRIFEAVLGSGKSYSIEEYLEKCFRCIHKDWREYVRLKPDFKAEYRQLVSDPTTIFSLGWKPETDFEQMVKMMISSR